MRISPRTLDMFPVPRIADQLVKEWAQELSEVIGHPMAGLVEFHPFRNRHVRCDHLPRTAACTEAPITILTTFNPSCNTVSDE